VGGVVAEAAAAIPDGLLVFLPSYVLLDKLMARWKVGGMGLVDAWGRGRTGRGRDTPCGRWKADRHVQEAALQRQLGGAGSGDAEQGRPGLMLYALP
jgi:hypothetical protein